MSLFDPTNNYAAVPVEVDFKDNQIEYWPNYSECNGIWLAVFERAFWKMGIELDFDTADAAIPYLMGGPGTVGWIWEGDQVEVINRTEWADNDIYNLIGDALSGMLPSPVISASVHLGFSDNLWNTTYATDALLSYGIWQHHAYTVMDIGIDPMTGDKWIQLRDPYGYRSIVWETDGLIKMPFDHFLEIFSHLGYGAWLGVVGGESDLDGLVDGGSLAQTKQGATLHGAIIALPAIGNVISDSFSLRRDIDSSNTKATPVFLVPPGLSVVSSPNVSSVSRTAKMATMGFWTLRSQDQLKRETTITFANSQSPLLSVDNEEAESIEKSLEKYAVAL